MDKTQKVFDGLLVAFTGGLFVLAILQWCTLGAANRIAMLANAADVELAQPEVTSLGNGAVTFALTFKNAGHTVAKNIRVTPRVLMNFGELAPPNFDPRTAAGQPPNQLQPVGIIRLGSGETASYSLKQEATMTGGSGRYTIFVFGTYAYHDDVFDRDIESPLCLRYDSDSTLKSCLTLEPVKAQ